MGKPLALYRNWDAEPTLHRKHGNLATYAENTEREKAIAGSITLERECRKAIERQARRWGIRADQAEALLLDRVARL